MGFNLVSNIESCHIVLPSLLYYSHVPTALIALLLGLFVFWRSRTLAGAALLWLACTGVALHFVHHLPQGVLVWDGATWFLEIPGQPPFAGHLRVHMDAQARMLLSLCGEGHAVHWIWVERHMHSACWMDLRRAVYSRPRLVAGPAHPTDTS